MEVDRRGQRAGAVVGHRHLVSGQAQENGRGGRQIRVVINHQNAPDPSARFHRSSTTDARWGLLMGASLAEIARVGRVSFTGFPVAALDFYDDLEMDNTKSFWEAHKQVWKDSVQAPMIALTDALAEEFGTPKVFRPYRDVRFAKDKTPYKTNQGAWVARGPSTGWYVEVAAPGVRVGAGVYDASSDRLAKIRAAIDDPRRGRQLEPAKFICLGM